MLDSVEIAQLLLNKDFPIDQDDEVRIESSAIILFTLTHTEW